MKFLYPLVFNNTSVIRKPEITKKRSTLSQPKKKKLVKPKLCVNTTSKQAMPRKLSSEG